MKRYIIFAALFARTLLVMLSIMAGALLLTAWPLMLFLEGFMENWVVFTLICLYWLALMLAFNWTLKRHKDVLEKKPDMDFELRQDIKECEKELEHLKEIKRLSTELEALKREIETYRD